MMARVRAILRAFAFRFSLVKNGRFWKLRLEQLLKAIKLLDLRRTKFIYRKANRKGKVHGSLARAGKVKGQTPKVEKVDKKKKVTGF
jgi:Ribosomal protein S30